MYQNKDSNTSEGQRQPSRTGAVPDDGPPSYEESVATTLPNVVTPHTSPLNGNRYAMAPPPKYEDLPTLHATTPNTRNSTTNNDLFHHEISLHEDPVVFSSGTLIFQPPSSFQIITGDVMDEPVDDALCLSVISLLCCAAIGVRALMKSMECREALRRGDEDLARIHGHHARNMAWLGISLGAVIVLLFLILFLRMKTGDSD